MDATAEAEMQEQDTGHSPNYMAVFAALAALTLIEVGVAFVGFPKRTTVLILVGLALWKATLVALYYMHLRFESRRLVVMVLAPLPLALILVMAALTDF
jgi:cytochrome c oxidase subunit IV